MRDFIDRLLAVLRAVLSRIRMRFSSRRSMKLPEGIPGPTTGTSAQAGQRTSSASQSPDLLATQEDEPCDVEGALFEFEDPLLLGVGDLPSDTESSDVSTEDEPLDKHKTLSIGAIEELAGSEDSSATGSLDDKPEGVDDFKEKEIPEPEATQSSTTQIVCDDHGPQVSLSDAPETRESFDSEDSLDADASAAEDRAIVPPAVPENEKVPSASTDESRTERISDTVHGAAGGANHSDLDTAVCHDAEPSRAPLEEAPDDSGQLLGDSAAETPLPRPAELSPDGENDTPGVLGADVRVDAQSSEAGAATEEPGRNLNELGTVRSREDVAPAGQSHVEKCTVEKEQPPSGGDGVFEGAPGRGATSPRRPSPREDAAEFRALLPEICDVELAYARWNTALIEKLLLSQSTTDDIYLCITPRVLASAFSEAGFDQLMPEEAQRQFADAVSNMYHSRVLPHSGKLRVLRRCGSQGEPDCAAYLAASVLAAYRMQSDDEAAAHAYYVRLAELLRCEMSGAHPAGFQPAAFESLWVFLQDWLREEHDLRLATPTADVGLRRFVALPLAHVPLRCLDIEKLPAFFYWAGYEPGGRVQRDRLYADLCMWQQARNSLTQPGTDALHDDRREAVLAQVASELESWDGTTVESVGQRSATVEVLLDVIQRRPQLSYLPRRPTGFPETFDDGDHVFQASDEGWYDPTPMTPNDGQPLTIGFEWRSVVEGTQFTLRRQGVPIVPLAPSSNYSGFLSRRRLLRGVKCAVLCRDDLATVAAEYLSEVSRCQCRAATDPTLPRGWMIFPAVIAKQGIETPAGLDALEIDPNVELLVSGGLRVGRRWTWLTGAPPRVLVTGVAGTEHVRVNGVPVQQGPDGTLMINGHFRGPGIYVVEAGRARRRIELIEPCLTVPLPGTAVAESGVRSAVTLPLPPGPWAVIGASPGQICKPQHTYQGGSLAECPFTPVWAVRVGSGPGAEVAVVGELVPPDALDVRAIRNALRTRLEQWAALIYNANIRRPRFGHICAARRAEEAVSFWKQYAKTAKQVKRALKGR